MSRINVNTISGIGGTFVTLANGALGDASRLSFPPNIISYSPEILSSDSLITTNISFTFNQNIEFSSTPGTIELRSGSATGSLVESYTTGSSSRVTINSNVLTINPTNDLVHDTTYYVILPSVGIANTFGAQYAGTNTYNFNTKVIDTELTGGNYDFVRVDSSSPTGFYRYHIFTGTQNFTLSHPSSQFLDMTWALIAGGGGGGTGYSPGTTGGGGGGAGGVKNGTGTPLYLSSGITYTFTMGAGGAAGPSYGSSPVNCEGGDSSITAPTGTIHTCAGGGRGGTSPRPTYDQGTPGGSGGGSWGGPGYPTHPSYPTNGYYQYPGGSGTPGQGNAGGRGSASYVPFQGHYWQGGGGGGAGGTGSDARYSPWPGPYWPQYPYNPNWFAQGGDGGNGRPIPAFAGPNLLGYVPEPVFPADLLLNNNGNGLGPNGYFGGGGGGGAPSGVPITRSGNGGTGGGGHGAYVRPGQYNPSPFSPRTPSDYHAENGIAFLGGGGGGGTSPNSSYTQGAGGSGGFWVRYAVNGF